MVRTNLPVAETANLRIQHGLRSEVFFDPTQTELTREHVPPPY